MTAAAHVAGTLTRLALFATSIALLDGPPAIGANALGWVGLVLAVIGGLVQSEADRRRELHEAEVRGARREAEARQAAKDWAAYNREDA